MSHLTLSAFTSLCSQASALYPVLPLWLVSEAPMGVWTIGYWQASPRWKHTHTHSHKHSQCAVSSSAACSGVSLPFLNLSLSFLLQTCLVSAHAFSFCTDCLTVCMCACCCAYLSLGLRTLVKMLVLVFKPYAADWYLICTKSAIAGRRSKIIKKNQINVTETKARRKV